MSTLTPQVRYSRLGCCPSAVRQLIYARLPYAEASQKRSVLRDIIRSLVAIDRYERRALSRRKFLYVIWMRCVCGLVHFGKANPKRLRFIGLYRL